MNVLKKHFGQICIAVFIAVVGVFWGVLPYFAMAKIVEHIANRNTELIVYKSSCFYYNVGLFRECCFP